MVARSGRASAGWWSHRRRRQDDRAEEHRERDHRVGPETHVIVLLVDERPEEVTDWQRTVTAAEVVYSTFDKPPDQHIQVTELVLEARSAWPRWAWTSRSSWTRSRVWRGPTTWPRSLGQDPVGGIDSTALYRPDGSSAPRRNIEEGGSLTIIASALVETGSRWTRDLRGVQGHGQHGAAARPAARREATVPAINVEASGTARRSCSCRPKSWRWCGACAASCTRSSGCRARAPYRQDPCHEVERAVPEGDREGAGVVSCPVELPRSQAP